MRVKLKILSFLAVCGLVGSLSVYGIRFAFTVPIVRERDPDRCVIKYSPYRNAPYTILYRGEVIGANASVAGALADRKLLCEPGQ